MNQRRTFFALVVIGVVGVALRGVATLGDPWLDEIWPIVAGEKASTLREVFASISLDGHASLATILSLYLHRFGVDFPGQRLFAFFCSVVTIPLLWRITGRFNSVASPSRIIFLLLVAISYPLTVITTESRGYGPMLALSLLALDASLRWSRAPQWRFVGLFWVSSALSVLFHPTAVILLVGVGAYLATVPARRSLGSIGVLFSLPALVGVLHHRWISSLAPGGGIQRTFFDTVIDTVSVAVGGPLVSSHNLTATVGAVIVGSLALGCAVAGFVTVFRRERALAIFLLTITAAAPIAMVLVAAPTTLSVRYFLISIVGLCWLIAEALGQRWGEGRSGRCFATLVLTLMVFGAGVHIREFCASQRGQYEELFSALDRENVQVVSTTYLKTAFGS